MPVDPASAAKVQKGESRGGLVKRADPVSIVFGALFLTRAARANARISHLVEEETRDLKMPMLSEERRDD